jgi:hypothetical protein
MKMKKMRSSILCLFALLFAAPLLHAQDLSKYRTFSLGTNLAAVLKQTNQKLTDVRTTHTSPSLFQELTWWPGPLGPSSRSDAVEQILFSFYNGELYKISVTYDRDSTKGLTTADMTQAITEKYGPPTNVVLQIDSESTERYGFMGKGVAAWDSSQYSVNLVRASFVDAFGLVLYSKLVNAEAELGIAEAAKLDQQEGPKREAERQQKETDDLEMARQKNKKAFQP